MSVASILREIREGTLSPGSAQALTLRQVDPLPNIPELYCHRDDVDDANALKLAELNGETFYADADDYGDEFFLKNCCARRRFECKLGALVR